jgi:transposase
MMPLRLRILLCAQPTDMRRSFDGLGALVVEKLDEDPTADDALFVFINARRDRAKLLWRDATGFCLLYKRLDTRFFALPASMPADATRVTLEASALSALLDAALDEPPREPVARDIARAARALARDRISQHARNSRGETAIISS